MSILTMNNRPLELFHRHKLNPILTAENWPYQVNSVFNPGATLLSDGTTLLLCRVEDRRGLSHLCAARSANGVDGWKIDPQPTLMPDPEHFPEELWGIEDPRITYVPELKQYAVVYTAYSSDGPGVALAKRRDNEYIGGTLADRGYCARLADIVVSGRGRLLAWVAGGYDG